jgi:PDZ domain-containing secreted protein
MKHAEDITPKKKVNHRVDSSKFLVFNNEETVRAVCQSLGYQFKPVALNADGFQHTSINTTSDKVSLCDAIQAVPGAYTARKKEQAGEDVSQRAQKYVKIKSGTMNGKCGILINRLENNKYPS